MSKFFLGEKENKMNDKILFYQWNAFMQNGIEASMTRMGIEYDKFYYIIKTGIRMMNLKKSWKRK